MFRRLLTTLVVVLFLVGIGALVLAVFSPSAPPADQRSACTQVWDDLQTMFETVNCRDTGEDHACYGNRSLTAQYQRDISAPPRFELPADQAPLPVFNRLTTGAFDALNDEWGVAVLKLQAEDLDRTMIGDLVTFVLYGQVQIEEAQDAQTDNRAVGALPALPAFYFSTGIDLTGQCLDLPSGDLPNGGLLIDTPDGYEIQFSANGVDVTLGSTVILHAVPNGEMTVAVLEGRAVVGTGSALRRTVAANEFVTVRMGGSSGLTPVGSPSVPRTLIRSAIGYDVVCQIANWSGVNLACAAAAQPASATATRTPRVTRTPRPPTSTPRRSTTECIVTVDAASANLRGGPGTNYTPPTGAALRGQRLTVIGQAAGQDANGGTWYLVETEERDSGWIASSLISSVNGCEQSAPFVDVPQRPAAPVTLTPTITPTASVTPTVFTSIMQPEQPQQPQAPPNFDVAYSLDIPGTLQGNGRVLVDAGATAYFQANVATNICAVQWAVWHDNNPQPSVNDNDSPFAFSYTFSSSTLAVDIWAYPYLCGTLESVPQAKSFYFDVAQP